MLVSGLIERINSNSVPPKFTFTMSKPDRAGMRVDVTGLVILVILAVAPLSGVAFAEGAPDAGVEVALRTGVALPYGHITVGAEAIYRFTPAAAFAPWVGVGLGYEWAAADITFSSVPQSANSYSYRGLQGLVQVGGDGRVGRQVVLGPFVEVALGRFDKAEEHTHSADFDATIDLLATPAWHAWLSLGVRGAYGFTSSRR
jgi:hypothetical protein